GGVRGVEWDHSQDDRTILKGIARWATALSAMRSEPAREPDPQRSGFGAEYMPARTEQPRRAYAVLYNLARGHALLYGRARLTTDDRGWWLTFPCRRCHPRAPGSSERSSSRSSSWSRRSRKSWASGIRRRRGG